MPRKKPATKLNYPLSIEDRAELDSLCAMLEYVEVSLADRFGNAPAHAVRASRTIVKSYFEPEIKTNKASFADILPKV